MEKEVMIESFIELGDAINWMEYHLDFIHNDDIHIDIDLIEGKWRVGIITSNRQTELPLE